MIAAPIASQQQMSAPSVSSQPGTHLAIKKSKPFEVRKSNIEAARAIAEVIKTSLGPRGMDKMIAKLKGQEGKVGEVIVTNDGATILKHMSVIHPCARMVRIFIFSFALLCCALHCITPLAVGCVAC